MVCAGQAPLAPYGTVAMADVCVDHASTMAGVLRGDGPRGLGSADALSH